MATCDLSNIVDKGGRYLFRLLDDRPQVYFSASGAVRAGHVYGYIQGVAAAGNTQFAERLAQEFENALSRLTHGDTASLEVSPGHSIQVPARKCILNDDGTLHGFSVLWCRPYLPELSGGLPNEVLEEYINRRRLWETVYSQNHFYTVKYAASYNGGLIYHGPGAGETFTVNLSSSGHYWGIHT